MDPFQLSMVRQTRRSFLGRATTGIGSIALGSLLDPRHFIDSARASDNQDMRRGVINPRHHPPRAKRVIFLYMAGGPSHLETFDYKPKLAELHGQPIPLSVTGGQQLSPLNRSTNLCVAPQTGFTTCGQSRQSIANVFPHLSTVADDLCIIRSMKTDTFVHDPAHTLMCTGSMLPGHPSMGSWVWYGLGSESADLPGFILLFSYGKLFEHPLTRQIWHNGFLPTRYQSVEFRSKGDPVLDLRNLKGVDREKQRDVIKAVGALDRIAAGSPSAGDSIDDPEIAAHISKYELAFRMQTSVPELTDLSTESAETLAMYGTAGFDGSFASNCLLARRLAERGVRFIQLVHLDWDHHIKIHDRIRVTANEVDQGMAALLKDLKRCGLLNDTLVIWGGEFGRTPVAQGRVDTAGRDHHHSAFSMWLAGGGIKAAHTHGVTDDFGFHVVQDPVHVHDLHATVLHVLGVDHERLTYRYQGRDFRLTDVSGQVIRPILA